MVLTAALAGPAHPAPAAAAALQGLGAHYDATGSAIGFRVYSARATRIEVYLYKSPSGAQEQAGLPLTVDPATRVWSVTVPAATLQSQYGITGTVYYGYRAWGPNWPYNASWTKGSSAGFVGDVDAAGNRFNPNKLLIDPYARELSHDPRTASQNSDTVYASGPSYRTLDSGLAAPKGIVLPDSAAATGSKPTRALKDDIVYEVHVRGMTANDPSVPAAERGTYKGAARKAAELAGLGVTAVEFLPVQETQNDADDADPTSATGDNYSGYSTLDYFAPDRRYASDRSPGGPTREFQDMVKAYHDAGIKVFTDVVYNHTGEGGPWNPGAKNTYSVLSFRGLDNPEYYELTADLQGPVDNTGVGGNYNTYSPVAQQLILDSLAYGKDTLGVDGFRFDLAPVLGNTCRTGCFRYSRNDPGTALNRITAAMRAHPRPAEPAPTGSPSPGRSATAAIRWATSRLAGPSGTTPSATPCAATRTPWASRTSLPASSPPASPDPPTCNRTTAAHPSTRSTSWSPTTASPSPTCTRATPRTTRSPGRTAPPTAVTPPTSARPPATASPC
ncbi:MULTISPECIES: alpha-amylase family glycosyl hydrolase [unclassified Streptomyces]|uniref:alpha-amylase family glycosyl hydrolase n=1 Tax=unclassified Streptomyces TaxID=2593676 RepID=UPI0018F89E6D|nr:alpha-amylase family glycosyl hydrolase [Streptomyces sp. BoleA5]